MPMFCTFKKISTHYRITLVRLLVYFALGGNSSLGEYLARYAIFLSADTTVICAFLVSNRQEVRSGVELGLTELFFMVRFMLSVSIRIINAHNAHVLCGTTKSIFKRGEIFFPQSKGAHLPEESNHSKHECSMSNNSSFTPKSESALIMTLCSFFSCV